MSTGAVASWRLGLVAHLNAADEVEGEPRRKLIDALELRWPADLFDDVAPYCEPASRSLFGEAAIAVARDVARESPTLVPEVSWDHLESQWRMWWIGRCTRLAFALTGIDLTDELCAGRPIADRDIVAFEVADSAVMSCLGRYRREGSVEQRRAVSEAAARRSAVAARSSADRVELLEHQLDAALEAIDQAWAVQAPEPVP